MIKSGNAYAVSSVTNRSWLQTPICKDSSKIKKKTNNNNVIYTIFEQCADLETDKYWIDLFRSAARGNFPKKFTYSDNLLVFRKANRNMNVDIPNEPAEALVVCRDFFRRMGGLISDQDIEHETTHREFSETDNTEVPTSYSELKKKKLHYECLNRYVYTVSKANKLSSKDRDRLARIINLSVVLGFLSDKNVVVEDGCIKKIIGMHCVPDHVSFDKMKDDRRGSDRNNNKKDKIKSLQKKLPVDPFIKNWNKHLSGYYSDTKAKLNDSGLIILPEEQPFVGEVEIFQDYDDRSETNEYS